MGKKDIALAVFLVTAGLLFGCTNNGTEIGNPGTKRAISGSLADVTAALTVATDNLSLPASCPDGAGPITVVLATPAGQEVTATVDDMGDFSAQIDQQQRYEVVFRQGIATCAELFYGPSDPWSGLHVVLGRGMQDIDLGDVTDQGGGVYVAANNPSDYCDDDGDGIPDSADADADGNGVIDSDSNGDGYIDWFYENETTEVLP